MIRWRFASLLQFLASPYWGIFIEDVKHFSYSFWILSIKLLLLNSHETILKVNYTIHQPYDTTLADAGVILLP